MTNIYIYIYILRTSKILHYYHPTLLNTKNEIIIENGEWQITKTTVMGKGHKDYLSVDQKIV